MFFKAASLLAAASLVSAGSAPSAPNSPSPADAKSLTNNFPILSCTLATTQESCHSAYAIAPNSSASCCYQAALVPGGKESGLVLQTQFYDTAATSVNPGPANSTTVHGLWPDYCDGTYPAFCTADTGIPSYNGSQIRDVVAKYDPKLLSFMDSTWTDYQDADPSSFWAHEQNKHGTCFSTLRPACQFPRPHITRDDAVILGYFRETVRRFRQLPTLTWLAQAGIVQSDAVLYNLTDVQAVLKKASGGLPYVGCAKGTNRLSEFWYYSFVNGPLIGAVYHPTDATFNSTCPPQVSLPVKYNATSASA
ncbi:hypothetical protein OC835_001408 [Tilletia horrida]|uniref:Uncharacterized protein n=1 Tax=Tilletia horrida TaxID=155126 RepID=A0AAN6GM21_9BASI|nr:hypothetical protein OC835_001408 [Tilletia horrida]KAK0540743.1 hypothetical protein OC842_000311 [Tilletia horrida]